MSSELNSEELIVSQTKDKIIEKKMLRDMKKKFSLYTPEQVSNLDGDDKIEYDLYISKSSKVQEEKQRKHREYMKQYAKNHKKDMSNNMKTYYSKNKEAKSKKNLENYYKRKGVDITDIENLIKIYKEQEIAKMSIPVHDLELK